MRLLISIADFADFTAFSKNIGGQLADPYIRDAQTFDVKLGADLYGKLEAALDLVQPEFKPDEFASPDFATRANVAGWADLKLAELWYSAVRPLLVCHSARRMLLWHGLHITPNSAELTTDRPISSQQRAELRADLQTKCGHYEALLAVALRAYLPATTPTTCGTTRRRRPTTGGLTTSVV
jgi:hypothetical protein